MGLGSRLRTRRLWLLAAALLTVLVILVTGLRGLLWWPVETSSIDVQLTDVASIQILPLRFGPTLMWNHPTTSPPSEQQRVIEAAIPIPLPGPEVQPIWCLSGTNLIVHLRDGRDITYGPCRHPASIRVLWGRLANVVNSCVDRCAPEE